MEMVDRVRRHWTSLLPVLWGPVAAVAGVTVGMRVLTEVASPATFGETRLLFGAVGLAAGLAVRPFAQYCMREYHDAIAAKAEGRFLWFIRHTAFRMAFLLAGLTVGGLLAARALGMVASVAACLAAGAFLVAEVAVSVQLSVAVTTNRQNVVSVSDAARQLAIPLAAAAGIALLWESSAVFVSSQAVVALASAWLITRVLGIEKGSEKPSKDERAFWTRGARAFALPMVASGFFAWFLSIGDRYLLAYFCPPADVGRYAAVYSIVSAPVGVLGGMLTRAAYPFVFRAAARHDTTGERRLLRWLLVGGVLIGAASVVGIMVFGPWIVDLTLAAEYREGSRPLLLWLALGQACLVMSNSFDMRAYAGKRTAVITRAMALGSAANLGLNLVLIPRHGVVGAGMATFGGYLAYLVGMVFFFWRASKWIGNDPKG